MLLKLTTYGLRLTKKQNKNVKSVVDYNKQLKKQIKKKLL